MKLLRFGLLTSERFFLHPSTIEISFLLHQHPSDTRMIFEGRIGPERRELSIATSNSRLFSCAIQKDGTAVITGLELTGDFYPFNQYLVDEFKEIAFKEYSYSPVSHNNKGRSVEYHEDIITIPDTGECYYVESTVRALLNSGYKSGNITIIRYDYTLHIYFNDGLKQIELKVIKNNKS